MEFLNTKEYFVTHTEKVINELKATNAAWDANLSIKHLKDCADKKSQEYQEVYTWLQEALTSKHTEQTDLVDKLTTEQCRYANYLIQSIYDSVTMTI